MRVLRRAWKALTQPRRALRIAVHDLLTHGRANAALNRLGGPRLLARLTVWSIDPDGQEAGRPSILVLDRLFFSKDVIELRRRSRVYSYPTLRTHVLSISQANWLPEELQEQISYAPRSTAAHDGAWARAEAYAGEVIALARRRFDLVALLASNVDYWQHEAFRRASSKAGLPFLTLCQELQTVDRTHDLSVQLYEEADFRYTGTAVAVFGARTRDMLIESRCCTPEQVWITGAPRLDPWFRDEIADAPADTLTFISYDGEQYFAPANYRDSLLIFAEASMRHRSSGLTFVLKCKDAEDERRAHGYLEGIAHTLQITNGRDLTELFPRSRLVYGYNSLALVEALLSPAQLALPRWSDAARPPSEQIVHPENEACRPHFEFVEGPDAFAALLDEALSTPLPAVDRAARRTLLKSWFYVPDDGSAVQASEDFCRHFIEQPGDSRKRANAAAE